MVVCYGFDAPFTYVETDPSYFLRFAFGNIFCTE
jgi:hypothetical protein